MNPELQKNLWLKFTLRRGVILALVVALFWLFARVDLSGLETDAPIAQNLPFLSRFFSFAILFAILAGFLGAFSSAGSISTEISERTWEQLKLSALKPFTLVWGKLVGVNLMTWLAAAACLAVMAWSLWSIGVEAQLIVWLLALFGAVAVTAQGAGMAAALAGAVKREPGQKQGRLVPAMLGALAGFAVWVSASGLLTQAADVVDRSSWWGGVLTGGRFAEALGGLKIDMWGAELPAVAFVSGMAWVAALFALIAAWRFMRIEMQMTNTAWAFPLFCIWLAFLAGGPAYSEGEAGQAIVGVMALAAYPAMFYDSKGFIPLRRIFSALGGGRLGELIGRAPSFKWPVAVMLVGGLAAGAPLFGTLSEAGAVARDAGVFWLFAMGVMGGGGARGDSYAAILLIIVHILASWVAAVPGMGDVLTFVRAGPEAGPFGAAVMLGQAALVWFLVMGRYAAGLRRVTAS